MWSWNTKAKTKYQQRGAKQNSGKTKTNKKTETYHRATLEEPGVGSGETQVDNTGGPKIQNESNSTIKSWGANQEHTWTGKQEEVGWKQMNQWTVKEKKNTDSTTNETQKKGEETA